MADSSIFSIDGATTDASTDGRPQSGDMQAAGIVDLLGIGLQSPPDNPAPSSADNSGLASAVTIDVPANDAVTSRNLVSTTTTDSLDIFGDNFNSSAGSIELSPRNSDSVTDSMDLSNFNDSGIGTPTDPKGPEKPESNGDTSTPTKTRKIAFKSSVSVASHRFKEPPLDEEDVLMAATFVQDAKIGHTMDYMLGGKYVRSYNLYCSRWLRWGLYLALLLDLCLVCFERPAVPGLEMPYWATMILEVLCLLYFAFRILHVMSFQHFKVFCKDPKNIIICILIMLTVVDIVCYIIWRSIDREAQAIRWSRPLRPFFVVNFSDGKQIRRAFRNIRRTVPDIMNVLVLFMLSVLLFGLLALKLFNKRDIKYPNGDSYFTNYLDSLWDLYVLVTTANNPDVMMPAYDRSNWFALFFIIYLILCLYIFMSIVLATIYNNYKKNLKNEIKTAVYLKRKKLNKAFDILKVDRNGEVVSHGRWKQLMAILLPSKSSVYTDLLMKILDDDDTNVLSRKNFMNFSDLLHVPLTEVKDRITIFEKHFPNFYNHRFSDYFKILVRHKLFRFFFDFMIIVNAFFIAFALDNADWFFLFIFTVEIICKFYVLGAVEFFKRYWNTFDFLVIGSAFVASIVEKALSRTDEEFSTLDILLVLRVMRLVKIFGTIKRFKVILQTLINIGPSISTYGGVILIFYYFFAIIGMEVFHGYINFYGYDTAKLQPDQLFCGNTKLNGTSFYKFHYCNNNFNDIFKSLVVLTELTVVNQWHVLTSGFVIVTSKAARIYFFIFHLCCVVIVLNIFTAFILEAFILEYSLQTVPKLESYVEAKIKNLGLGIGMNPRTKSMLGPTGDQIDLVEDDSLSVEVDTSPQRTPEADATEGDDDSDTDSLPDLSKEKGLKFHLKKKRQKKVEVLLQYMFQGELAEYEDDESEGDSQTQRRKKRTRTLEEI